MPTPQPELHGELVSLRLPQPKDIPAVMATANDPESIKWTPIPEFDVERATNYVANASNRWRDEIGTRWAVADRDDNFVGMFDLTFAQGDPGAGEVFFMSEPSARGKGYMTAALRLAGEWALREHGLERLEWQALVGNIGSQRVAEKAGFKHEGVLRLRCLQRGERYDSWVASLTKADLVRRA